MKKLLLVLILTLTPAMATSPDRVIEIKKSEAPFPATWKLYYRGTKDNYVVFYDVAGHEVWFQYRRNKFDDEGINKIRFLLSGLLYEVSGEYTGLIIYRDKLFQEYKKAADVTPEMKNAPSSIPVFKLTGYRSLAAEELLY